MPKMRPLLRRTAVMRQCSHESTAARWDRTAVSGIVHWKPAPNLAKSCKKARRVKHGNGAPDGENKLAIQAFPTHPQFLSPRGTHCPWVSPDGDMMNPT